jgi:hypothetical protein
MKRRTGHVKFGVFNFKKKPEREISKPTKLDKLSGFSIIENTFYNALTMFECRLCWDLPEAD